MSLSARASGDKSQDEIYTRFEQVESLTPIEPGGKSTHDAATVSVPASQAPLDPAIKQERTPASETPSIPSKEDKI